MSIDLETRQEESRGPSRADDYASYRAMSTLAVASLIVGLLSVLALVDWMFGVIPLLGMLLAWRARREIGRRADELTGGGLATAGGVLSALFLLGGWALLGTIYVTEVPEGYRRISYADLQPEADGRPAGSNAVAAPAGQPQEVIPLSARQLDGQRVFIKGYMFPGAAQSENLQTFILVRDNGACCFGGNTPKLTDMILVTLEGNLRATYTTRLRKLAGTFKAETKRITDPEEQQTVGAGKIPGVLYQLHADYLK